MNAARKKARNVLLIGDDPLLAEWGQLAIADACERIELTVLPVGEGVRDWLGSVTPRQLPNIILIDLQMPKLDGLAVLRTLRKNVATRDTPVVGFSAEYAPTDVQMGYKVGANVCVAKPVSQQEFKSLLEQQMAYWLEPRQRELAFASK